MQPQMVFSPADVERALGALKAAGNPLRVVGRIAGLGNAEMDAGVPAWGWALLSFGVGVFVGAQYWPRIQDQLRL